jgi:hypothetical protein
MLTILSLCDYSGAWSQPYLDAGYDVIRLDLRRGDDVRLVRHVGPVRGVLAAPPCTHFARSGARCWKEKGDKPLLEGLAVLDACARIILAHCPLWWAIENPEGRIREFMGKPAFCFNPCDYGDPWTKKTLLWGNFKPPLKKPISASLGSITDKLSSHSERTRGARSTTPSGFARAFFEANP